MKFNNKHGFTLLELMISCVIMAIITVVVFSLISSQEKAGRFQDQHYDMAQKYRWTIDNISNDIRQAGYGVPASSLDKWMPWNQGAISPVAITDGSQSPDSITLIGSFLKIYPFDSNAARLTSDTVAGSTTIVVNSTSPFNTTNKSLIFLGGYENALVKGISGNTLTIDTNPFISGNQGISNSYLSNTTVEVVKTVTYYVSNEKVLKLDADGSKMVIADCVEDFDFSLNGDIMEFYLKIRSTSIDPGYKDGIYNDGFRRISQKTSIKFRNNF